MSHTFGGVAVANAFTDKDLEMAKDLGWGVFLDDEYPAFEDLIARLEAAEAFAETACTCCADPDLKQVWHEKAGKS